MRIQRVVATAAVAACLTAACGDDGGGSEGAAGDDPVVADGDGEQELLPPTQAEAQQLLDDAIWHAQAGDWDALCDMTKTQGMCENAVDMAGRETVPEDPPEVAGTVAFAAANGSLPARVIVACGVNTNGHPFEAQLITLRNDDGSVELQTPVWWHTMGAGGFDQAERQDDGSVVVGPEGLDDAPACSDL